MAAWDLAERLCLLPEGVTEDTPEFNPHSISSPFKDAAQTFLGLTGADIPVELHLPFDEIDITVRQEILPALDIIQEEWDRLRGHVSTSTYSEEDMTSFARKCTYLCNKIELEVIIRASDVEKGFHI